MNESAYLTIDGPIATITLDRPESLNAIDIPMARCLASLMRLVESTDGVRVVVIRGNGGSFCAGGDIAMFAKHLDDMGPPIRELLTHLHTFLATLRESKRLIVTSIHGSAAGAGFSLAFMGDFCIAAEDAVFRPSYAKLGVSPDGGGTIGLVEAVGTRGAMQILLGQDVLTAAQAETAGLIAVSAPASCLEAETFAFAKRLAAISPDAAAATKALIYNSHRRTFATQLDAEMEALLQCMASDTFKTNVERFVSQEPVERQHG